MCGITRIISFNADGDYCAPAIEQMNKAIRHRGPDDEGFLLVQQNKTHEYCGDDSQEKIRIPHIAKAAHNKASIALGHRRLSINDLSPTSYQPMCYLNRYWIIFNGEIYNFVELRDELLSVGYTFNSHGDTEIILAAYDKWGAECVKRFNGMWAIIIYDQQTKRFFISRDRFGVKPLYYYKNKSLLIFASEIKSILTHPLVPIAPNMEYLHDYLISDSKDYSPVTPFKDIYRFNHACYFEGTIGDLGAQPTINEKKFWELKFTSEPKPFDLKQANKYAAEYYSLLEDAVRIRLRADVPVGSALSGGLDSSSVVYIINQLFRKEGKTELQKTFSTVYKTPGLEKYDESKYIEELAGIFNLNSKQIEPNEAEALEAHRNLLYHLESPPNGTILSSWFTYMLVSRTGVKVTLDGQGADEQQGGYLLYLINYFCNLNISELYSEYRKFSGLPNSNTFIAIGIAANFARQLKLQTPFLKLARVFGFSTDPFPSVNEALYNAQHTSLITLLHYADSSSMGYSIESRMPFMDYRLMEFWGNIPASYKLYNGWTKYIARLAMNKKLPDNITWRKDKMGWPIPEDRWFRGGLKEAFCKTVEDSPIFKMLEVFPNVREKIQGKTRIKLLLRYYNIAVWYDLFFLTIEKNTVAKN